MSEIKFVGKGTKVFIVYDERGVEVPNFYIRSTGTIQAEKTAQARSTVRPRFETARRYGAHGPIDRHFCHNR